MRVAIPGGGSRSRPFITRSFITRSFIKGANLLLLPRYFAVGTSPSAIFSAFAAASSLPM